MKKDLDIMIITTTLDDRQKLEDLCRTLVEKKLVACAQVSGPIKSLYWWKGTVEETEEWVGTMKTRIDLYKDVEEEIMRLHPYEIPEIVAHEILNVLPAYKEWVINETSRK